MIITTSGRASEETITKAIHISKYLKCKFIHRRKQSVEHLQKTYQSDCIVVGNNRLELFPLDSKDPFFFHPNSSSFRLKRLLRGDRDPFLEATKLEKGMFFLDCTMGLASDSIVAAFAVGDKGKVIALEGNLFLQFIVERGLMNWNSDIKEMNFAMRRIIVKHANFYDYLLKLPDDYVDVVYFDPMFEESVLESDGILALKQLALYGGLTESVIVEAKRVAKSRIVLKDHFRSKQFEKFGFQVIKRKSAKFHFGVIELR